MITFLTVLSVLLAIVIVAIVLLQQGKGSDLGSAFGGGSSNSMFGALGPSGFLGRLTYIIVAIWLILSFLLANKKDNISHIATIMYVSLPKKPDGPSAPNIEFEDPPPNAEPRSEPLPC